MENNSKLIIVTGGNRGIGYSIIEKLLEKDRFKILLTSRDEKRGKDALQSLSEKYPQEKHRLLYHTLDVTSSSSIDAFAKWIADNKHKIYILINNAAVLLSTDTLYLNAHFYGKGSKEEANSKLAPKNEVDLTLATNFYGLVNLTEKLLPYLEENGRVLNVSSLVGKLSFLGETVQKQFNDPALAKKENLIKLAQSYTELAYKGEHIAKGYPQPIYFTSKTLVTAYTRWILPNLLKKSQTTIAIHPGEVITDMNPNGKLTVDDGIASTLAAVHFSDEDAQKLKGKYIDEQGKLDSY